jgi:cell division protein FtsB
MPAPRRHREGDVDILLKRADNDRRERRYIYGGDTRTAPPVTPARTNRQAVRRRFSTSNVMLAIFAVGIAIVLYINNIIAVNRLAHDVNELQQAYDRLRSSNAALQAEVNRKAAMERIGDVAFRELGLRHPAEKPAEFPIDEETLETLKARQARP